ncbi:CopG family antitoxin [Luteolibacter sp. AS25]|uniref:CopG family antitoxin n=1 Tax=Luteolibacter sp. AS25 TaxID=3135776 RepID=UPI00398A5E65
MKIINSWTDLPDFDSDTEEHEFWQNHELAPKLMVSSVHELASRESTTITLRFDPRMLSRIKRVANSRFLNYQSMMKQWLAERLEDEMK